MYREATERADRAVADSADEHMQVAGVESSILLDVEEEETRASHEHAMARVSGMKLRMVQAAGERLWRCGRD